MPICFEETRFASVGSLQNKSSARHFPCQTQACRTNLGHSHFPCLLQVSRSQGDDRGRLGKCLRRNIGWKKSAAHVSGRPLIHVRVKFCVEDRVKDTPEGTQVCPWQGLRSWTQRNVGIKHGHRGLDDVELENARQIVNLEDRTTRGWIDRPARTFHK
jgi:hypothetical protein